MQKFMQKWAKFMIFNQSCLRGCRPPPPHAHNLILASGLTKKPHQSLNNSLTEKIPEGKNTKNNMQIVSAGPNIWARSAGPTLPHAPHPPKYATDNDRPLVDRWKAHDSKSPILPKKIYEKR